MEAKLGARATVWGIQCEGAVLENSGSGSLDFDLEKVCIWKPEKTTASEQYYVIQRPGIDKDFEVYLNEMIAKVPVVVKN